MKQKIAIKRMECFGKDCVIMELSESDREKCKALVDEGKPLAAVIGTVAGKRSLSANAYAWVLMNQLAEKINRPVLDIYRDLIRDIGDTSDIVTIPAEAVEMFKRGWESKGDGWQAQLIDTMTTPNGSYSTVQCWYGSSVYDSSQMHRLIELIVQECQQQGIPTLTPDEIARLKGLENAE